MDTNLSDVSMAVNTSFGSHELIPGTFRYIVLKLSFYLIFILIVIGVLGNTLSFVVFVATSLRHQSSSVYLAFLNFADTLFLLCLSVSWLGFMRVFLMNRPGWCQLTVYLSYVSGFLSVWTVVSFTIERFIVVYFPLMRLVHCTKRRARVIVLSLLGLALIMYNYIPWTTSVQFNGHKEQCLPVARFDSMVKFISTIDTVITLAVPFLLISVLNILIVIKVWRFLRRKDVVGEGNEGLMGRPGTPVIEAGGGERRRAAEVREERSPGAAAGSASSGKSSSSGGKPPPQAPREVLLSPRGAGVPSTRAPLLHLGPSPAAAAVGKYRYTRKQGGRPAPVLRRHSTPRSQTTQIRTTRTLLIISTMFVVLNLPSHGFRLGAMIVYLTDPHAMFSENLLLVQLLFQLLYYANFSSNFFMYCACSQAFRKELRGMLTRLCNKMARLCASKRSEWEVRVR